MFTELKLAVLSRFPTADVSGTYSVKDSFEIFSNGNLIYSKLEVGTMPQIKQVMADIEADSQGGSKINGKKSSLCAIL